MKKNDECVFSALEDRSHRMVTAERHDKWRVFHEEARSSGCGACSPQRYRQCPILRQRQSATAAARRDEGVTLRPRFIAEGVGLMPAPFFLTCRLRSPDLAQRSTELGPVFLSNNSGLLVVIAIAGLSADQGGGKCRPIHRSCRSITLSAMSSICFA
jgi:hypothetical protein